MTKKNMIPNNTTLTDDDWAMIRTSLYASAHLSRQHNQQEQANQFSELAKKLTPTEEEQCGNGS